MNVIFFWLLAAVVVILTIASYVIATFGLTGFWGAPFVATPERIARKMLRFVEFRPGEVITDLGSGSGSILIMAAKEFGAKKAIGYEINPILVWISRLRARWSGVADKVEIHRANFYKTDLEPTDVLALYLLAETMDKLQDCIKKTYRPETRIVSRGFQIPDVKPVKQLRSKLPWLFLYRVGDIGVQKRKLSAKLSALSSSKYV